MRVNIAILTFRFVSYFVDDGQHLGRFGPMGSRGTTQATTLGQLRRTGILLWLGLTNIHGLPSLSGTQER